jgi:hypothetical protein
MVLLISQRKIWYIHFIFVNKYWPLKPNDVKGGILPKIVLQCQENRTQPPLRVARFDSVLFWLSLYCMEHTYSKRLFIFYLKFKINWCSVFYLETLLFKRVWSL